MNTLVYVCIVCVRVCVSMRERDLYPVLGKVASTLITDNFYSIFLFGKFSVLDCIDTGLIFLSYE